MFDFGKPIIEIEAKSCFMFMEHPYYFDSDITRKRY